MVSYGNQEKDITMNVLTRYIATEVLKGSLITLLVLLSLFNLFTFSDELVDLGKGHYGLKDIFYYLLLTSPTVFYELMPASALLGSLFVLGAMANNYELIAMRASGLSVFGIIKAVMFAGVVLALISIVVGEFVAPKAEQKAQLLKTTAKHDQVIMDTRYGMWLRDNRKFINVRQILENGKLADITIYELNDKQQLRQVSNAKQATYLGDQKWQLEDIKQSIISIEQMQTTEQNRQFWTSTIAPDLLKIVVVNPNNLSLLDLAKYIDFLKTNRQKSQKFELAFWGRIVNPLVTFVMLLVAAPFVIGIKRGISMGGRMLIGIIIGMGFNIIDKIVGHLGLIYDLTPALIAITPSLIVFALAIMAIRRTNV
jgi:lipopolysaccharide export system permease protein